MVGLGYSSARLGITDPQRALGFLLEAASINLDRSVGPESDLLARQDDGPSVAKHLARIVRGLVKVRCAG